MPVRSDLKKNGYHIFNRSCSASALREMRAAVASFPSRRAVVSANNNAVSWDEIDLSTCAIVTKAIIDPETHRKIEAEFGAITQISCWANRYQATEYIPKHTDSRGSLQIIVPIQLPPTSCGGDLLIHHRDLRQIVPQSVGSRIIFDATKTPHETTALIESDECVRPVRTVCIARVFFAEEDEGAAG
jgi:hypothetical protein